MALNALGFEPMNVRAGRPATLFSLMVTLVVMSIGTSARGKGTEPTFGRAPYDGATPASGKVSVAVSFSAAQQILAALAKENLTPGDAGKLLALDAVRREVQDSGKPESEWISDFAEAFSDQSHPVTFDLRTIRQEKDVWAPRLQALAALAPRIEAETARRVSAMLPSDGTPSVSATVEMTFGLSGLADHLMFTDGRNRVLIVVDLSRATSASPGTTPAEIAGALSRLAAQETFRRAWQIYRQSSPGWNGPETMGPLSSLAKAVTIAAPIGLYSYDKDFFPLSSWLHDPMIRAIDAFNRVAGILIDPKTPLDRRAEILSGVEQGELQTGPALAAGAFFADGIYERLGHTALLKALAGGPQAFFQAYARAVGKKNDLPPLSDDVLKVVEKGWKNAR